MSINETLDKLASLPAGELVYRGSNENGLLQWTHLTTDELKELAEELRGVQEMLAEVDYICLKSSGVKLLRYSNTGQWTRDDLPWREFSAPAWNSPLEAFQSLKEKQQ